MFLHKAEEVALNLGQGLGGWTLGGQRATRGDRRQSSVRITEGSGQSFPCFAEDKYSPYVTIKVLKAWCYVAVKYEEEEGELRAIFSSSSSSRAEGRTAAALGGRRN